MQIFFSCYPTQKKDCANDIFQIINAMIPIDWERGWGRRIEGWSRLYDSLFFTGVKGRKRQREREREEEGERKHLRKRGRAWTRSKIIEILLVCWWWWKVISSPEIPRSYSQKSTSSTQLSKTKKCQESYRTSVCKLRIKKLGKYIMVILPLMIS